MSQWAVYYDDGTGNTALYGPYRSKAKADKVYAAIHATGVRDDGATIRVEPLKPFIAEDFRPPLPDEDESWRRADHFIGTHDGGLR